MRTRCRRVRPQVGQERAPGLQLQDRLTSTSHGTLIWHPILNACQALEAREMLCRGLTVGVGAVSAQCGPIIPGPIIPEPPIMPRIIRGIPSRTKPVTSWEWARIACVSAGSSAVSSAITPVGVRVNWRR